MSKVILSITGDSKPDWFKIKPPTNGFHEVKDILKKHKLVTVCQEAHCPNVSECWSGGTATFMVMGDTCTRGCRFCNIKTARFGQALDENEPDKIVQAVKEMDILDYIVLTSVDRDDLEDQGANHFAKCISKLKEAMPNLLVEVLIPDFQGKTELLDIIIEAKPDVIAHNVETVKRLQNSVRDPRANYTQSLEVLTYIKNNAPSIVTKTSLMLGLGETQREVVEAMDDIKKRGVQVLTFGQYLRPSVNHLPVSSYLHPKEFENYKIIGEKMGFAYVASGPFVRSSYKAGEYFIKNIVEKNQHVEHAKENSCKV